MKKIVKLLPVALALMISVPAFADASKSGQAELNLTVPEFINITKDASTVAAGEATFDDTYEHITNITPQMHADFTVITNKPDKEIYLQAVAPIAGSPATLYGTASDMNLVFVNTTNTPDASSVNNITAGGDQNAADNPNAIAFKVTPVITPDTTSGASNPTTSFNANKLKYTLKNGKYSMKYEIATSAVAGTFSTHDTNGTYQATLVLTDGTL